MKYMKCNGTGYSQQPANYQPLRWKMPSLESRPEPIIAFQDLRFTGIRTIVHILMKIPVIHVYLLRLLLIVSGNIAN